jgi:NDP-sugar pyrophosphorylase family protein
MVRAVILTTERGERLLPLTENTPKPLLRVLDRPLLEHTINALKSGRISHYIIATGYMAQAIRNFVGDGSNFDVQVRYSYNPAYDRGNATSLKQRKDSWKATNHFS